MCSEYMLTRSETLFRNAQGKKYDKYAYKGYEIIWPFNTTPILTQTSTLKVG